ncbi:hypothetical protein AAHB33_07315 [Paenarthrobacter sp. S56]|uniref:hypothetical protein n=1 Tax=Paenarthrobacter sp. S56 TaxID=3138179 RepID=UPI00321AE1D6
MPELRNPLPAKQPPRRYRLNVPSADEAVAAWMEMQDNQSLSIRMLIRESIERNGYVDIVNRPVVQLSDGGRVPEPARAVAVTPAPAAEGTGPAPERPPAQTGPPGQEGPQPELPEQASGGQASGSQVDVNDLFAQLRR